MADTINVQDANQWLAEIQAKARDLVNVLKGGIDVGQSGALGDLALVDTLSEAAIGNASTLKSALGFLNVWAGGTVNSTWPNSTLNDITNVGADIYFCGGTVSDKPTAAYGIVMHIPSAGNRAYQVFVNGFNSAGPSGMFARIMSPDVDGNYPEASWGKLYVFDTKNNGNQDWAILGSIAAAGSANAVGVYTLAKISNASTWHGNTTSGANLIPAGVNAASVGTGDNGTPLTGTWRCMGRGAQDDVTLWLKVSD